MHHFWIGMSHPHIGTIYWWIIYLLCESIIHQIILQSYCFFRYPGKYPSTLLQILKFRVHTACTNHANLRILQIVVIIAKCAIHLSRSSSSSKDCPIYNTCLRVFEWIYPISQSFWRKLISSYWYARKAHFYLFLVIPLSSYWAQLGQHAMVSF